MPIFESKQLSLSVSLRKQRSGSAFSFLFFACLTEIGLLSRLEIEAGRKEALHYDFFACPLSLPRPSATSLRLAIPTDKMIECFQSQGLSVENDAVVRFVCLFNLLNQALK